MFFRKAFDSVRKINNKTKWAAAILIFVVALCALLYGCMWAVTKTNYGSQAKQWATSTWEDLANKVAYTLGEPPTTTAPPPPENQPLDCSNAVQIEADLNGDNTTENVVVIPVHDGATTLYIGGWSVSNGMCEHADRTTVAQSHLSAYRTALKRVLGNNVRLSNGMTPPITVYGNIPIVCNVGSGTEDNCWE